jgi:hypothetical protein
MALNRLQQWFQSSQKSGQSVMVLNRPLNRRFRKSENLFRNDFQSDLTKEEEYKNQKQLEIVFGKDI